MNRQSDHPANRPWKFAVLLCLVCGFAAPLATADEIGDVLDLSLTVGTNYPCTWPEGWPIFQINHYKKIGPASAYNSDIVTIDQNTGTQIDFPPHSVARLGLNLPNANQYGSFFADKVEAWKFGGEACVIDIRHLLGKAPKGVSPLVLTEHIQAWEREHRPLGEGDVVVLYSGYNDKFYHPLPEGNAFIVDVLEKKKAAWPDPHPDCMEYIAQKGVRHIAVDSPSMGPFPNLQEPTHFAGLKYGAIFTESAKGLNQLPATGTFYWCSGPRHALSPCCEARALAITEPNVAKFLIKSTREKRVTDLSVVLADDLPLKWPGHRVGHHRQGYYSVNVFRAELIAVDFCTKILDSNSTTHLVPPVFALPEPGFDNRQYDDNVREWLAEYERKYGPRGHSDVTTEKVPLSQSMGWARVIDVTRLIGTTDKSTWPASPEITEEHIQNYEHDHGDIEKGQVVIFHTGHLDRTYRSKSDACMVTPLKGESEGWPAPGPDAIGYLARRGVRCVAIDAPSLGGVGAKQALFTYWALASQGMLGVEFLINVGHLPEKAYFLFAPIKIEGCHGGPGRAIAYH